MKLDLQCGGTSQVNTNSKKLKETDVHYLNYLSIPLRSELTYYRLRPYLRTSVLIDRDTFSASRKQEGFLVILFQAEF